MEEWKTYKLGEVGVITTGKTPSTKHDEYFGGGIHFITPADLNACVRDVVRTERTLSKEGLSSIKNNSVSKGSICVSCIGNLGYCGIAMQNCATNQQINSISVDEKRFDRDYIYYGIKGMWKYFKSLEGQSTTISILNKGQFSQIEIVLPPLSTQHSIASILKSLDDKIEVNRRINDNLESQAQSVFKSWLIDFEPFKDGKFEDSELGPIPEVWRVGTLGEIAVINPPRTLKKGQTATYLDMKNMPTSGSFPSTWETKEYNGGMKFQNEDTIMARITPCLENGKVAYVNFLDDKEIAFGSTEYIVMTPKDGFMPELLYFLCREDQFKGYVTKNMNGSSGRQRVSGETIGNYKIAIPPREILLPIASYFKSVMNVTRKNGFETRFLASLRDTVLPRLMSGELTTMYNS